jgi:hypothetical protein
LLIPNRKKKKQLSVTQKKNLKKISKFNKKVLKETLPDDFLLEKIQNNISILKQPENGTILFTEKTSDDNLFFGALYCLITLVFYTIFSMACKLFSFYFLSNCFDVLLPILRESPHDSIFNFFGSQVLLTLFRHLFFVEVTNYLPSKGPFYTFDNTNDNIDLLQLLLLL